MKIVKLILYFCLHMSLTTLVHASGFDPATGLATEIFKKQLNNIGVTSSETFSYFLTDNTQSTYHACNLSPLLNILFFQKDLDYYKKGGKAPFPLNIGQAKAILDCKYEAMVSVMPQGERKMVDVLIPGGAPATMEKQLHSLRAFLQAGFSVRKAFCIVKDKEAMDQIHERLKIPIYAHAFKTIIFNYFTPEDEDVNGAIEDENIFADLCKQLQRCTVSSDHFSSEYAIIAEDPVAGSKNKMIASSVLDKKHTCIGVACNPIKDWGVDFMLSGYHEEMSVNEATIAWALSILNLYAHEARSIAEKFKKEKSVAQY